MTRQPQWKLIGQVGDIYPLDYDGGFVYQDETRVYAAELEYIVADNEEDGPWNVYRICLDRVELVTIDGKPLLVPFGFGSRSDLPYSIETYDEWFNKDLASVADAYGRTVDEYRSDLCSDDDMVRANVYLDLAQYWGWDNFDSYPLRFSDRMELEARYA